jgi:hypothetical protein
LFESSGKSESTPARQEAIAIFEKVTSPSPFDVESVPTDMDAVPADSKESYDENELMRLTVVKLKELAKKKGIQVFGKVCISSFLLLYRLVLMPTLSFSRCFFIMTKKVDIIDQIVKGLTKDGTDQRMEIDHPCHSAPPEENKLSLPNIDQPFFCSVERIVINDISMKGGSVVLRSAVPYVVDFSTKKEHPLRLIVADTMNLPLGMEDNLVCCGCVERNRAMGLFHQ